MLELLGIVIGLTVIIVLFAKDFRRAKKDLALVGKQQPTRDPAAASPKELDALGKKAKKEPASGGRQRQGGGALPRELSAWGRKQRLLEKDVTDSDLQVMATILTAGLVDVDPSCLQHLKEFRDLRGSST